MGKAANRVQKQTEIATYLRQELGERFMQRTQEVDVKHQAVQQGQSAQEGGQAGKASVPAGSIRISAGGTLKDGEDIDVLQLVRMHQLCQRLARLHHHSTMRL